VLGVPLLKITGRGKELYKLENGREEGREEGRERMEEEEILCVSMIKDEREGGGAAKSSQPHLLILLSLPPSLPRFSPGKYVVPALIEKAMAEAEIVSQALIYGADRPYNVAILVPNWEKLQAYGVQHTGGEVTSLSTPEEIGKLLLPSLPPSPPSPPLVFLYSRVHDGLYGHFLLLPHSPSLPPSLPPKALTLRCRRTSRSS